MRNTVVWLVVAGLTCPTGLWGQRAASDGSNRAGADTVSNAGVLRATATVDSVFVDRSLVQGFIGAGDFASYLMARLRIRPIPSGMGLRVSIDTTGIVLAGRLGDLPPEAAAALGPLFGMLPAETEYAGYIELEKVAREVVRFRLARVTVNRVPIPEPLLAGALLEVGRQYPDLSRTGRDLFVEIPQDAEVLLVAGGVALVGPPVDVNSPGSE